MAIMAASCNFLEVEHTGKSDIGTFFSEPDALNSAVTGLYNLTYSFQDHYMIIYPEVTGDLAELSATSKLWTSQFNYISLESEESDAVGRIWKDGHEILLNACEITEYGPELLKRFPARSAEIKNNMANAHFLRALATFDLALVYGQTYTYTPDASHLATAVLRRFPNLNDRISRSSALDTYGFILSELETAISLWENDRIKDVNYASEPAAKALMARIYLYMGDYENAFIYSDSVIKDYGIELSPREEYFKMFCDPSVNGKEAILRLNGYDAGTYLGNAYDAHTAYIYPSEKLKNIFSQDSSSDYPDIRELLISYDDGASYSGGNCMKYTVTTDVSERDKHYDPFILRLSEMYLIRAEANCRSGNLKDAADDIITLQARATGMDRAGISLAYSNAEELDALIMRERIKELYLEGHRLFDITRRHESLERGETNSSVRTLSYPDDRFILPIPLVELESNKAMQSNPINSTQQ